LGSAGGLLSRSIQCAGIVETSIWENIEAGMPANGSPQVTQRAVDTFALLTAVDASRMGEMAVAHRKNESGCAVRTYVERLRKMRER